MNQNPSLGSNLIGAFTILKPGDHAVLHRHTAAAIRFATRAEGAVTIVNGRRCEMHAGDLVLTPPMCWHGHINEGRERTYWFDAANMPLVCGLEASFFERTVAMAWLAFADARVDVAVVELPPRWQR